jgi:ubiquinone/menaquinone biosynthesis C-methylase UbiE
MSARKRRPPPPRQSKASPPTGWEPVSRWYDDLVGESGSEYHQQVVLPGAVRLLAPRAGERIIDVACGQGVLCRRLQQAGIHVVGVDAAAQLVEAARKRSDASISYYVGDARDLWFLPADSFDAAACVLAIQNIHPIAPVFAGVQRLLRPGGRFVMAMMHPAFRGTGETSWGWDQDNRLQYRRVDRYLTPRKTPIVTHPGSDPHHYTWTFHKPIESFVAALRRSGMLVDAIEEWPSHKTSTSGPRAAAENLARKEIPMFMAIRAIKAAARPAANDEIE